MKLSRSRSSRRSGGYGRRIFTLLIIAAATVMLGGAIFYITRTRAPILPILETNRSVDAIDLWRSEDYPGVIETSSQQLARYPLEETSLTLRGFARFYRSLEVIDEEEKQELLVGAVQDLRRVLLLPSPSMEREIRYVLGKAYYHRGAFFYDSAVRELEHARDLGMEPLDLFEYLALAHTELGNREPAIQNFRTAIEMDGQNVHRLRLADVLLSDERHDEAESLLLHVLDSSGDVILQQHGLRSLGVSRRERGQYDAALDTFREILEVNDSSAEARYQLGETYLAMGENDRARFEWREALRLNPNHIESFQRLQEY